MPLFSSLFLYCFSLISAYQSRANNPLAQPRPNIVPTPFIPSLVLILLRYIFILFYFTFALISDKIFIYGQPYFWRVRNY